MEEKEKNIRLFPHSPVPIGHRVLHSQLHLCSTSNFPGQTHLRTRKLSSPQLKVLLLLRLTKMKALKVSVPSGDSQPGIQIQKLMQRQNHRIMGAGKDLQGCPVQPVTVQTTEVKIQPRNLQTQESPLGKSQQHLPSRNQLPLSNTLHLRQ